MGQTFSNAISNLGSFFGKAASFGLALGETIGATLAAGPFGFAASLPGLAMSGTRLGASVYDLIRTRNWNADWSETEKKIFSGNATDVTAGLNDVASGKHVPGGNPPTNVQLNEMRRVQNAQWRKSGQIPPSEIAKVIGAAKLIPNNSLIVKNAKEFAGLAMDISSGPQ